MDRDPKRKLVLAIDDDSDMIELVHLTLGRAGYEVVGTTKPLEAVSLVTQMRPDLILLDVMMPEMDGWQVFEALRADETTKNIPIILVTAKNSAVDRLLGMQIARAADYINKPLAPGELLASVQQILPL
jgi:two-component system, OmpR family, response regulator VicR